MATSESRRAYAREYYRRNSDKLKAQARARYKYDPVRKRAAHLRDTYGLTPEEYDAQLQAQGGVCAICGNVCETGRRLAVDHDHDTGAPRGLLCASCNQGLGKFRDNPALLRNAQEYVDKEGAWQTSQSRLS